MEQRLSLVTLGVRDLGASRAFYKRLGWKESSASTAEVAFFQCGGLVFALWGREALAEDAGVRAGGEGFANVSLAHNVRRKEDVDATLKEAEKVGARILKPGVDTSWGGRTGYFADPEGFAWEVAWNPGFEILPDGGIKLPG
jgi:catechol 2,3-dioxygenase-like lactoylglutathione lyase family enzyme